MFWFQVADNRSRRISQHSVCGTRQDTLALDRTVLANERTYQAWLRTGFLAAMATGLGAAKFLQGVMPSWVLVVVSTVLMVFSMVAYLQASWRYSHLHLRMAHLDIDAMSVLMARIISYILTGCSLLALGGLLITVWL